MITMHRLLQFLALHPITRGPARAPAKARPSSRRAAGLVLVLASLMLAACGGGGAGTEANPIVNPQGNSATYNGPTAATQDVQRFKLYVWDELVANNRCGQCHGVNGQVPRFVRNDDINLAYAEASTSVDLGNPAASRLVTKVGGGHNCWLGNDAACADVLTRMITNWASDAGGAVRSINLVAPPPRDPGSAKSFPASAAGFASNIHPLLRMHCSECHSEDAEDRQSPFFASADVSAAYAAARSKIDLDTPAQSRLVVRLCSEFHNCWSACASDANAMQAAIANFSSAIPLTEIDPTLVVSKALTLQQGIVASSGGRFDSNVIALWEFKTGSGTIAFDTSGVSPSLDLTFSGDVTWVGGYGIRVANRGRAQGSTTSSRKLQRLLSATGEYSIEAWVAPNNVSQGGPARIVSYSGGTTATNVTLGQTEYNYDFLTRSTETGVGGMPALSTADGDRVLQATQQHVVATFSASEGRRLYVNGNLVATDDTDGGLGEWDDTFAFILGNEVSGDRPWSGVLRLVAVHSRALTQAQVRRNFDAGVGERYFLLFGVGSLIDTPNSFVLFEVEQFDSYSYLFSEPRLVVVGNDPQLFTDVPIAGLRIGINGREAGVGQAYANLDTTLMRSAFDAEDGVRIANVGTIIALDRGPADDEFFLTFDRIGTRTHARTDSVAPTPTSNPDLPAQSDVGVRNFDEINASMSAVTTVPRTNAAVRSTYRQIVQQLPSVERLDGFVASNQMAVTQLAIEYCNALVESPSLASAYFPALNLSASPAVALPVGGRGLLIDPLVSRMVGQNLNAQPRVADVTAEVDDLITRLSACGTSCPADRTRTIAKSACAAVLGSAALLIQ